MAWKRSDLRPAGIVLMQPWIRSPRHLMSGSPARGPYAGDLWSPGEPGTSMSSDPTGARAEAVDAIERKPSAPRGSANAERKLA